MGQALAEGFITQKVVSVNKLILVNPHAEKLNNIKKKYNIKIISDNKKAAESADIVILAVKPKIMQGLLNGIKDSINNEKIVISTAAGVSLNLLENYLQSGKFKICRIMPNIPMACGQGVIGWLVNKNVSKMDKKVIKELLNPLGFVMEFKNDTQIDRLTLLSGCGPAYVAYLMGNFIKVAQKFRFSEKQSQEIINSIFTGTVGYLSDRKIRPEELLNIVATKGGITEEVLKEWERKKLLSLIFSGIDKGYDKIKTAREEMSNGYL